MVRSCRYSTPLWLFEKNSQKEILGPPMHAFLRNNHINFNSVAARPCSLKGLPLCWVRRGWGLGKRLSVAVKITSLSVLSQQRDFTVELIISFCFLTESWRFPISSSQPQQPGTLGAQVAAPQDPDRCCLEHARNPLSREPGSGAASVSEVSLHPLTRERRGANPRTEAPEAASGRRKRTESEPKF